MAFLALSSGAFGYPMEKAARVALSGMIEAAHDLESVRLIRFVLFSPRDLDVHADVLSDLS